MLKLRCAVLE